MLCTQRLIGDGIIPLDYRISRGIQTDGLPRNVRSTPVLFVITGSRCDDETTAVAVIHPPPGGTVSVTVSAGAALPTASAPRPHVNVPPEEQTHPNPPV